MKRSLKSKRNINNVLRSKLFLIFCLTLVVLLSVSVVKEMLRKNEINQEIKVLETEIVSLEDNNQELTNLIDYLNSLTRFLVLCGRVPYASWNAHLKNLLMRFMKLFRHLLNIVSLAKLKTEYW